MQTPFLFLDSCLCPLRVRRRRPLGVALRAVAPAEWPKTGAVYQGPVLNITKFGASINTLPGRDGLVDVSKLGGGRCIDRVEEPVSLGDEVRLDDMDPQGKVWLRFGKPSGREVATVSFEEAFDAEVGRGSATSARGGSQWQEGRRLWERSW